MAICSSAAAPISATAAADANEAAMREIWGARDLRGTIGDVKMINVCGADSFVSKSGDRTSPMSVECFLTELWALKRVEDAGGHPNVVALLASCTEMLTFCVEGGDADMFTILRHGSVSAANADLVVKQVASGLLFMIAKAGICHRDVKLENIVYFKKQGVVKLIDMQFAKLVPRSPTAYTSGTPEYAAPELLGRKPHFPPFADVYSLGVCYFAMLFRKFYKPGVGIPMGCERTITLANMLSHDPRRRPTLPCLAKQTLPQIAFSTKAKNIAAAYGYCGRGTSPNTSPRAFLMWAVSSAPQ